MANTRQSPLISGAYQTLQSLGKTFNRVPQQSQRPVTSPKSVDVGKFSNLSSTPPAPQSSNSQGFRGKEGQKIGNLGTLTVPYGGGTKFEKFHPGIDIGNVSGTKIPSFSPGKVTKVVSGKKHGDPGFGNFVVVTDASGAQHRYSHLQNSFVKVGQQVNRGQQIGSLGATGQTYSASGNGEGPHLDYRIKNAYGKYVNPFAYLARFTGKEQ